MSLLKFTHASEGAAADGRSAIFTALGNVTCSIVGTTGTSREFRLTKKPVGPEADATSALALGVLGTGTSAVLAVDAIGPYVVELWINTGSGLTKHDAKQVIIADQFGLVRLPDKSTRADISEDGTSIADFDGSGRGMLTIHDRNSAKVRAALQPLIVDAVEDLPVLTATDLVGRRAWVQDLHRWATADYPYWYMDEVE